MGLFETHGGSSLYRSALCPGSAQAEQGLPHTTSVYAEAGNNCHAHMAWWMRDRAGIWSEKPAVDFDADQAALLSRFEQQLADLMAQHGGIKRLLVEHGIDDGTGVSHPDLLIEMMDDTFHLPDYKTGWAELDPPCENAQLRVYAVLAAKVWPEIKERGLYAYLLGRKQTEPVFFAPGSFEAYKAEIDAILLDASRPDAPRLPGSMQCKYCKAYGTARCPESQNLPAVIESQIPATVTALMELPAATIERHWDLWKAVAKYGDLLKDEIKRRINDNPDSLNLALAPTGTSKTVSAQAVYERLNELPEEKLFAGLSLSIGNMKKVLAEHYGLSAAKADALLWEKLGDAVTFADKEPKIVKKV